MKRIYKILTIAVEFSEEDFEYFMVQHLPGKYTPIPHARTIDRKERGDWLPGQCRYFFPFNYDPEHPEYAEEAYRKMEEQCSGEYKLIGVTAEAYAQVYGEENWGGTAEIRSTTHLLIYTRGVELRKIEDEAISELKQSLLKEYGFSDESMNAAPVYFANPQALD